MPCRCRGRWKPSRSDPVSSSCDEVPARPVPRVPRPPRHSLRRPSRPRGGREKGEGGQGQPLPASRPLHGGPLPRSGELRREGGGQAAPRGGLLGDDRGDGSLLGVRPAREDGRLRGGEDGAGEGRLRRLGARPGSAVRLPGRRDRGRREPGRRRRHRDGRPRREGRGRLRPEPRPLGGRGGTLGETGWPGERPRHSRLEAAAADARDRPGVVDAVAPVGREGLGRARREGTRLRGRNGRRPHRDPRPARPVQGPRPRPSRECVRIVGRGRPGRGALRSARPHRRAEGSEDRREELARGSRAAGPPGRSRPPRRQRHGWSGRALRRGAPRERGEGAGYRRGGRA